jgi:hypothetical protein
MRTQTDAIARTQCSNLSPSISTKATNAMEEYARKNKEEITKNSNI